MKYKYVGDGAFFSGLPAVDLDDEALTEDQKRLLDEAVAAGLYTTEKPAKQKKEKPTDEQEVSV